MCCWLNQVADHVSQRTGMDADDIHEFFKRKFLPARIIEVAGETVECHTTTKLTALEMAEYMDRIYAWVTSELGVLLPLPQEFQRTESRGENTRRAEARSSGACDRGRALGG